MERGIEMTSSAPRVKAAPRSLRLLTASVAVTVLSCLLASWIQSSGGRVRVYDIKIPTQNGQWIVADLFKPAGATAQAPAPLVVVVPGFQRSKEALAGISIELSRRGVVVIAIDPYAKDRRALRRAANPRRPRGMGCSPSSISRPTRGA